MRSGGRKGTGLISVLHPSARSVRLKGADKYAIMNAPPGLRAAGRKETDGAWLLPSFFTKAGTDFEILSLVIMIFMLVFAVLSYNKPGK